MIVLSLIGCGGDEPAPLPSVAAGEAAPVTLVYSSRMDGEIEPCG